MVTSLKTIVRSPISLKVFGSLSPIPHISLSTNDFSNCQSLFGHLDEAIQHLSAYHEIWKQYGFIPEAYNLIERRSVPKQSSYLLRPEFIESVYYLYRATKDPVYISMAIDVLTSIEQTTKTSCGHATVANVVTHQLENRMESFFLAETIKYLYLIFDEDNFVNHIPGDHPAPVSHLSSAGVECTLENGGYVFNTEAHPIDPGALHCCSPKLMSPSSSSATATEAILTAQHHPKQNTVSAEDLERLSREEAQYQPTEELLNLVDSVFAEHLNIDPDMTDPTSCISFEPTPTRKPCANLSSINQALVEPWLDLRQFVLQLTNDTLMKNHSSGTVGSLDEDSVITDFNAFEPPLLTCPYPPFHQRYTYSGQMVITEN
ncbi:unnamed protein product [Fasciola hepatica]|uniref:alpha-1,2-Mannosidase n=1 Tax=Fasciola hepatica TaxID=6192 RepID=A0ABC9HGB8_FASHE|nr:unnamed protein product [Fasciola hepatica]